MNKQTKNGKVAGLLAICMVIGGLPLLVSICLVLRLTAAREAGHPYSGDAIGMAIMSVAAYTLALLTFCAGAGYFAYQRFRHKLYPRRWHRIALAWSSIELAAPLVYCTLT
jgi:hypothetical protein